MKTWESRTWGWIEEDAFGPVRCRYIAGAYRLEYWRDPIKDSDEIIWYWEVTGPSDDIYAAGCAIYQSVVRATAMRWYKNNCGPIENREN